MQLASLLVPRRHVLFLWIGVQKILARPVFNRKTLQVTSRAVEFEEV